MRNLAIDNFSSAKGVLSEFLYSDIGGRGEIRDLVEVLKPIGNIAIFGGMIRDICLDGIDEFFSDIDIVIDAYSQWELEKQLGRHRLRLNSFGGVKVNLGKWEADIWTLSSTWAFREGIIVGRTFKDLIHTTFFDWDAVVFDIGKGELYASTNYFDLLRSGVVGLNLEANPSVIGSIARILRVLASDAAKLSPTLTEYLRVNLPKVTSEAIRQKQRDWPSYRRKDQNFSDDWIDFVKLRLNEHRQVSPDAPFML